MQKKLLKEGGVERTSAASAVHDVYSPSEAAQQLPSTPEEKFLESARSEILKMDPSSESFLPNATSARVDSALEQVFGQEVGKNPGYPQMQAKITTTILREEHYREVVEDFLEVLVKSEYRRLEAGSEDDGGGIGHDA